MSDKPNASFVPLEALRGSEGSGRAWRSLAEYNAEPVGESEQFDESGVAITDASRRRFLSLMAGSMALAGLAGCTRQPVEPIMPYVNQPENVVPGNPKYYATAAPVNAVAEGVIVESHLGRPTKVEGNPDHPASLGATSVLSQACLMDLYDVDRVKEITWLGVPRQWEAFENEWTKAFADVGPGGAGFRILSETVTSPTLGAQIRAVLKKFPAAKWHQYDPAGPHSARRAAQAAFGRPVNTYYNFADADVVLALDSDFLAFGTGSTRYARDFSNRRRRGDRLDMNRLYAVESTMTATGGKADHRLAVRYTDVQHAADAIAAQLGISGANAGTSNSNHEWLSVVARDLAAHKGASVVIPGEHQSAEVHLLAHALNGALGNIGKTVFYTEPLEAEPTDQAQSLRELTADLNSGQVQVLLILGGNPVYNAPADFAFTNALQKVKTSVHVALHFNETSLKATWHIPEPHFLEDWGDTRAYDGTVSIIQPLIAPLYDSHSQLQVLDAILGWPGRSSYEIVRAYWAAKSGAKEFEQWWRKTLHDGLVANSALPTITPVPRQLAIERRPNPTGELELVFRADVYLYDGRYANNVWLQELPHPMTKLTWDNAVFVSTRTARRLGLENQEKVELIFRGKTVEGSVWILPGHPDESLTLDLGWGRTHAGRAGDGAGFNAYLVRVSDAMWHGSGVEVRKLNKTYPLASTQMHQAMEGRDIVIHGTLDEYKSHPDFVKRKEHEPPENLTLYPHWDYRGYAWAMSIDTTACVNCQACVIACQAENNIPVVGKEQVLARRPMHWLRVDVYYEGGYEVPAAHYAPVPCMHCENAPCEVVCPTQATNHSSEGLNNMVYNRCVGTRYCSNNCPYKVRRFNFLLYEEWKNELWKMQRNPDVTVRSRGVMEKCTYCVQRIREAEIAAELAKRPVRDGEIKTACQQVCPTEAIMFGDKNNPHNRVAKRQAENLNYSMLSELNTRPRTTYLAELRNPNPELKEGTSA
ncbi:MAG: 4Fe-4S dicluster domain-containing protein [Bryobacteraceae bacterium]